MSEAPEPVGPDPDQVLESAGWLDRLQAAENAPPLGRLGRFEVLDEVARGGQAVVYRAIDPTDGRVVAIKCFTSFDRSGHSAHLRLQREIRATRSLSHPGVVRILDVESDGKHPLLVLEWIDGDALDVWANRTAAKRSVQESVEMAARISEILVHAHQRGVIHRDLKPSNILVDPTGMPHVVDFGLAKFHDESLRGQVSAIFAGTLAYAAPELLENGLGAVDSRSDVYALGVMLYQMLAGRLPYELGDSISSAVEAIRSDAPDPIRHDGIDAGLQAIVAKSLAKRPEDRYQSADALHSDLQRSLAGEPVSALSARSWDSVRRLAHRHPVIVGLGTTLILAMLVFAGTMATMYRRAHDEVSRTQRAERFLTTTLGQDLSLASPYDEQRDALRRTSAAASMQFAGEPEIESRIRTRLARHFADQSLWADVTTESRRALELIPADHKVERVEASWYLGLALTLTGKENGEPLLQEALAAERAREQPDPTLVAGILQSLAFIHGLWQPAPDLERAEREFQESFAWRERDGTDNISWVQGLHTYSKMQSRSGDLDGALTSLDHAHTMLDRLPEVSDRHRRIILEAHAHALRQSGRLREAEVAFRQAIAARNGKLDAALPPCWAFLGDVVYGSGRPAEALELYETAVITRCELLAERSPMDQAGFQRIATAIREHGLRSEELLQYTKLLQERAPDVLPAIAYTTRRIARVYADLGRMKESQDLLSNLQFADDPLPAPRN